MSQISKNLKSNQTIMVQYIHIPRIIIPLWISVVGPQKGLVDLVKSITSGDVLFNLRYIMKAGLRSTIISKEGGDSVFSINLATINHILMGIKNYLDGFQEACVQDANNKAFSEHILQAKEALSGAPRIPNPYNKQEQYLMWLCASLFWCQRLHCFQQNSSSR